MNACTDSRVIIRKARLFDITRMHAIEKEAFPTPWSFDALFSDAFLSGNTAYYVAECDGDIAGYGGMWLNYDEAHVTNIAVKAEYRRRGIAEGVLQKLFETAERNGIGRMTLEVRESNAAAIALYEKHGFKKAGKRPKYYSNPVEDAFIMWKESIF